MRRQRWLTSLVFGVGLLVVNISGARAEGSADSATENAPKDELRPDEAARAEEPGLEGEHAEHPPRTNGTSTASMAPSEADADGAGAPASKGATHHSRPPEMAPGAGCCQDATIADQPSSGISIDSARPPKHWGVMLGVGVPDGLMLSGLYRPVEWARMNAGLGHNGVSLGARVGGALVPFGKGPFLGVDLGHYFAGNANKLVRPFAGSDYEDAALLESVGYSYLNLRLGLELGSERFAFIMRGGLTFLRMALRNIEETVNRDSVTTRISLGEDPMATAVAPTLDLGFAVYL